jgi:hypothetical protein
MVALIGILLTDVLILAIWSKIFIGFGVLTSE